VEFQLLKADIETSAAVLEDLFSSIWDDEKLPDDWKRV